VRHGQRRRSGTSTTRDAQKTFVELVQRDDELTRVEFEALIDAC
jgi:hypothetical protein